MESKSNSDKYITVQAKGDDTAEVLIYDSIGKDFWTGEGVTAKAFAESLKALGKGIKNIHVDINSPGGSVMEATAIYNTLVNHPAKVIVNISSALSAATIPAMAGDEVRMAANGFLMIHDPSGRA